MGCRKQKQKHFCARSRVPPATNNQQVMFVTLGYGVSKPVLDKTTCKSLLVLHALAGLVGVCSAPHRQRPSMVLWGSNKHPDNIGAIVNVLLTALMWLHQVVGFLQTGVTSNWWGLGCSGLLFLCCLCFLSGGFLGVIFTVFFFRDTLFVPHCLTSCGLCVRNLSTGLLGPRTVGCEPTCMSERVAEAIILLCWHLLCSSLQLPFGLLITPPRDRWEVVPLSLVPVSSGPFLPPLRSLLF